MQIDLELVNSLLTALNLKFSNNIPIYSIEGLAGSGKSTQIQAVITQMENQYAYKGYYFELPTSTSAYGHILKSLYLNTTDWSSFAKDAWWVNPLFLLFDILDKVKSLQKSDIQYILMSRGLISTYIYNMNPEITPKEAIKQLDPILFNFPYFKRIFFLDLPIEIAYERIIARNRQPLRQTDCIDGLNRNLELLNIICNHLQNHNIILKINANQPIQNITDTLAKAIFNDLNNLTM